MLRERVCFLVSATAIAVYLGGFQFGAASAAERGSQRQDISRSEHDRVPHGRLGGTYVSLLRDRDERRLPFTPAIGLRVREEGSGRKFGRRDRVFRSHRGDIRGHSRKFPRHHRAFWRRLASRRAPLPSELQEGFEGWLRERLAEGLSASTTSYEQDPFGPIALNVIRPAGQTPAPQAFSTTNLQEAGVDEADSVKFDGEFLYIAPSRSPFARRGFAPVEAIRVLRAMEDPARTEEIGEIEIPGITEVSGMYLLGSAEARDARLLVVGSKYHWVPFEPIIIDMPRILPVPVPVPLPSTVGIFTPPTGSGVSVAATSMAESTAVSPRAVDGPEWRNPWDWSRRQTVLHLFDVSDPTDVRKQWSAVIDGDLVSSRRIGEKLHLVTRASPHYERIEPQSDMQGARLQADDRVMQARGGDLMPQVVVEGGEPEPLVLPRRCFLPEADASEVSRAPVLTTVTSIDLRRPRRRSSLCMGGMAPEIYSSTEALYLAAGFGRTTSVHKFAYGKRRMQYRGKAKVAGFLAGAERGFALGEHEGVLGVVTDLGRAGRPEAADMGRYRLTLLRESLAEDFVLEEVSQLPNEQQPEPIGHPGDLIHGVRFVGERLYVVTYRNIDPLYAIDLSDPQAPRIAGQLEVPGFSDYLHPIGNDLILGIGFDTLPDERNDWFQGVKVELFDVSDPASLESIDAISIGRRGSQSVALSDHHGVSHLPAGPEGVHRFAVPIRVHDREPLPGDRPSTFFPWLHTGLYLFEVQESSSVDAARLRETGAVIGEDSASGGVLSTTTGDRSVIQGTAVHYVHERQVWSAPWDAPDEPSGPE